MRAAPTPPSSPLPALLRQGYLLLGLLALGCALLGALLPLMPTTVFLIIAAACFGRSSPRLQARMLAHHRVGPLLQDWQQHRAIGRRAKTLACGGMALGLLLTLWQLRPGPLWTALLLASMLGCALYVLSRPAPPAVAAAAAAVTMPITPAPTLKLTPLARRRLGLALSAGLHLLLLAGLLWERTPLPPQPLLVPIQLAPLRPSAAPPLPVEQRRAEQVQREQKARPEPPRLPHPPAVQAASLPMPLPQAVSTITPPRSEAQPPAPVEPASLAAAPPSPALPPAPQPSQAQAARDSWQARLLAHLAQHRSYPPGARARREQGVVQLWLRVSRAGQVLELRVERSSGHPELDRAALATVRRAVPLPPAPAELPEVLSLLLPVEFFLHAI